MTFRIRLAILMGLLTATVVFALNDIHSRHERTQWQRPIRVAVALVQLGPLDQPALNALNGRFHELEARLAAEYHRYGGRLDRPITFTLFGPVTADRGAPPDPDADVLSLGRHAYDLWRWTHAIDEASKLESGSFDSRIYLVMRAPEQKNLAWVEGSSELGGRVGVARVELDTGSVDLSLFVVAHELLHTLGASDKYDATGHALIPDGLVEPNRVPLLPQRYVEVMARNRVVAPGVEDTPDSLSQLGVGVATAREIGWAPKLRSGAR